MLWVGAILYNVMGKWLSKKWYLSRLEGNDDMSHAYTLEEISRKEKGKCKGLEEGEYLAYQKGKQRKPEEQKRKNWEAKW